MVPLILVVGYLGSGKTTFLQRVVTALGARNIRPRVILNDYQDASVDAARLSTLQALVTPISGDCVCCGSRDELFAALLARNPQPDSVVLVEANGTSDAAELHDMLALDPRLGAFSRPIQVTVIDVSRWQKRWFDKTLERDQTETASHVWLNWAEDQSSNRVREVEAAITRLAPGVHVTNPEAFSADMAELVTTLGETADRAVSPVSRRHVAHHDGARHHFASLGVAFPSLVSRAALHALVMEFAPFLRRAKGVVTLAESPERQHTWSFIGGDRVIRLDALPESGFPPVAVFIGAQLPAEEICARIEALSVESREL